MNVINKYNIVSRPWSWKL